ncbi:MAG: ATP-dependent DNA helicase PcrA [Candidatus Tyloplasma litorale]|nr:MAG: ATP-dependent DNA helicase PcrA [Mycoplasmatales bacterium]
MLNLNKNQLKAVKKIEGPLRIIAGPGSGKTRTIVSKIAYILKNNLASPNEILAITFTNKATKEISERILEEVGEKLKNVFTYHGWCNSLLRIEHNELNLDRNFVIIDSSDSQSRISNLIKENEFIVEKKEAISFFDKISREEIFVKELNDSKIIMENQIATLWEKYNNSKKINGQLDFNDLITEVKKLLTSNENIRKKWMSKYKYIFIDEFQDTNNIQFEIIKSITNENSNITVVGDPDQNIYSWRGANIDLINNFNKWFPSSETIMLDQNYRSTPEIINAANNLIQNNKNRVSEFKSSPTKKHGDPIEWISLKNESEEPYEIVKKIREFKLEGFNYDDMAIIVRSSYKTRPLEMILNANSMPYKLIGAQKFYDRKEVKQTLKFLLFASKQSNSNLLDIINDPPKKFGPKKIQKTRIESEDLGISMWEYLSQNSSSQPLLISNWIKQTKNFIYKIKEDKNLNAISDSLEEYLEEIGYINRFFDDPDRKDNIKEILNIIQKEIININGITIEDKIIQFYNNATLSSAGDEKTDDGEIKIITAHASKGTEFPIVFIFSMNQGHWPSFRSIQVGELEEERRVAYVAMTRAMKKLVITLTNGSSSYGNSFTEQSIFVNEIIEKSNFRKYKNNENTNHFEFGERVIHSIFGVGTIIGKKNGFVKIKFDNDDKIHEILSGHKSYKVIKG